MYMRYIGFSLVFLRVTLIKSEVFTAFAHLTPLVEVEKYLAVELKNYVKKERDKFDRIERIADEYETLSDKAVKDPDHFLTNPVNAYLLIKSLTRNWDKLQDFIQSKDNLNELMENLANKSTKFPEWKDLQGVGSALLRLQDTYSLETEQIVRGSIQGVKDATLLTADDCFELGKIAYNKEDFYHCVMWMNESLRSYHLEDYKTVYQADVLDYLSYSLYKQGNLYHAVNKTRKWLELEPKHTRAQANLDFFESEIERLTKFNGGPSQVFQNLRPRDAFQSSEVFKNYEKLCQGLETHVLVDAHQLYCTYKRDHPLFTLAPLKLEVKNFNPWVAVYHEVLTESEIEKVKEIAEPLLSRSHLFGSITKETRTSKSAWLADSSHPLIRRIGQKASAVSSLSLSTVEQLQVLNYGIGGHYEPHHDYAWAHENSSFTVYEGNRIATVLFYLTDVEAGGATVFPLFGAKVFPEKGSTLVWYNLLRNGNGDFMTQHAGCPVLAGTKWVCNKWFHERGQEFTRPCTLNPAE